MAKPRLAVVLKGYPRLSETFIAQEFLNLEKAGFEVELYSLRHPTDQQLHPIHAEIQAQVNYLPEYLHREPRRVLAGWMQARLLPGYADARKLFLKDLRRDFSRNRIRRFGQALVLAAELPRDTPALYAHFLHTPASVTRYAATLRRLPWSCSAHARDIYTSQKWELREKLEHCQWVTTCTRQNQRFLSALHSAKDNVYLNYHGLDLSRFPTLETVASNRDGSDAGDPVRLLSVGRAVEKKGFAGLLNGLAGLDQNLHWQLTHIGGGPLLDALQQQADHLGIGDRIHWLGARTQQQVLEQYRQSDCFVLNSCIDKDGDRDGLPNVIVEAQSQRLPVVATVLSGIPELIEDQGNGLLVTPGDTDQLTSAIAQMISQPSLRQQLGVAGEQRVRSQFEMGHSFTRLESLLRKLVTQQPAC